MRLSTNDVNKERMTYDSMHTSMRWKCLSRKQANVSEKVEKGKQ